MQTSLDNCSKRSSNLEFPEEIHVKRQHTCENMSGTIMDLKSTKSSAKEAMSDEVVIPRRSTRLVSKVQSAPLYDLSLDNRRGFTDVVNYY